MAGLEPGIHQDEKPGESPAFSRFCEHASTASAAK
jgi:hypothetical protein